jgi:predicted hydrocarbon binding protein
VSPSEPITLPLRFFQCFLDTLKLELGVETLVWMLEMAQLPAELTAPEAASRSTGASAAEAYARIQQAMRIYYGRGARGSLTRIGRVLWPRLLASASFAEKAQAQLVRSLPAARRPKAALELLARLMRQKPADASLHTLDLDLLLVDHAAVAALGQTESNPVCYVTLGLIQESLFWADGREHDIEEVSCRAMGGEVCEFKIKLDGR